MTFYDRMASTASRLIEKFGQSLLLVRVGSSINPVTGVLTSVTNINYKVSGILQRYPDNLIDGTRIKASDRLIIIDGNTKPLIDDKVKIESQDWAIKSIQTSNPAGTALVYFVQVRR